MASCCKGGVQVYVYEPTVRRTKTIVVDGIFSVLGSSNFDTRSAQINEELDTTVYNKAFGRDAGGIRARFAALEALHPGRLRKTIVMGAIRRMGDAAVPLANIGGIDARASARGCALKDGIDDAGEAL